jgi:hypothetical protein
MPTGANTDLGYLDPPLTPAQASEAADPAHPRNRANSHPETARRYPARAYRTPGAAPPLSWGGPGQPAHTRAVNMSQQMTGR